MRRPGTGAADVRNRRVAAQRELRRFRQGSALAVALTAMVLLLWGASTDVSTQAAAPVPPPTTAAAVNQAAATIRDLALGFYGVLPRLVLAILIVALAWAIGRAAQAVLHRSLRTWERIAAVSALTRVGVFTVAAVAALTILAGDVRAAVGSVGLLGLAASWALQTPIESFTGWLLNAFRGYYRVGDRIAVGDVFGDVYRIDVLTTTVWEAGGPGKPVSAAQSTGALITFPNWEVLRSNIVNYSRDFPYVWDETTIGVSNESDLALAAQVLEDTARRVLGPEMAEAARQYQALLASERLDFGVDEVPRVYLSGTESGTNCTVRYLIPVRTRRRWESELLAAIGQELARPEYRDRIQPVYPRREVRVTRDWPETSAGGTSPRV
jgi:small-conductance mechanosensitive channel